MDSIKILKDEEALNEVSMDALKGGLYPNDVPPECCKTNTACNVNSYSFEEEF